MKIMAKETSAVDRQALSARERILRTASDLFYREGIRAVGIDTIIARAGVAKMSLYRHFSSKDDLIVAYLEEYEAAYWAWFDKVVASDGDPKERLLRLFDAYAERLKGAEPRGCRFINALAEFSDPKHPAHKAAVRAKRRLRGRLTDLAREAGARDADDLAAQLLMVYDGARLSAQLFGARDVASRQIAAARTLIEAWVP